MSAQETETIQGGQPPDDGTPPTRNEKAGNWLEKTRGNLMIVAAVIASMAFQAAVEPPALLWKDNSQLRACSARMVWDYLINKKIIEARNSAMNCIQKYSSQVFVICNTVSFSASLSIIILLTVLPLRHKISLWILFVVMSITVIFMAATYIISISLADGSERDIFETQIFVYYVVFWVLMLVLIIIIFALQNLFWLLKKLITVINHAIKFIFRSRKQPQESRAKELPAATDV